MSLPEPSAPVQSVFAVPAHISAITLAGGCGESHYPQNGAVDCAACAAVVKSYSFPVAPESAPAPSPEQPVASAEPAQPAPAPEAAAPALDTLPAPPKPSKKPDAAPSA